MNHPLEQRIDVNHKWSSSAILKWCTLNVKLRLMGHVNFASEVQYSTTIVYDIFQYESIRMKQPYTIVTKYCKKQAKLLCPSDKEASFSYID